MRCKGYAPAFQGLFKEEVKMQSDIFEEGEKTDKQILREMRKGIADKLLKTFNVGELVPHKWLQNEVGLTFKNVDTMENHTTFKKTYGAHQSAIIHLVRERGNRLLRSVKSKGYLLIHPKDHFSISASKSIKAILREHIRLEKSLGCIDYQLLADVGIGQDHPQLIADREARAWIDTWVRTLVSQDRPEYMVKLVEDALKDMSKAEAAEYS